ncbi:MAG: BatD family protein [Candidatus Omnitrophota bacterium]
MKRYLNILILCMMAAGSASGGTALAAEKKFEVSLDRNRIAIGEKAQLGLAFYGTQSMPAPDLGNIDGLDIKYGGPSTMMTVINGQVSSSITHMYSVQPLKIGKFQLGPFTFKYKGDSYSSNMIYLEAVEERVAPLAQSSGQNVLQQMNLGDRIYLTLFVDKPAAYVNELIPVTVKLYVNRLNVSDIQLPSFDQEGFSKVEFKEPKQYRERVGGVLFDVLEFKTSIFGTKPGVYRMGPARIKCSVMVPRSVSRGPMADDFFPSDPYGGSMFDDFFTRYERYPLELKSPDAQVVVSPLPAEGRPAGFTGAVGDYQFIFTASPTKVKVGDPITLRMDINGAGNFNTVIIPNLESTSGFKTYEPQVKTEENSKSFTQVLIPEIETATQVPKATFAYFDPNAREYKTISQGPIPLQVEKGKAEAPSQVIGPTPGVQPPAPAKEADLGRDIIYIKESPGIWFRRGRAYYKTKAFAAVISAPLFLFMAHYLFRRRQTRMRSDTAYSGRVLAFRSSRTGLKALGGQLRTEDPKVFYETLFDTLQKYLGYRLHIPPAGVTADTAVSGLFAKEVDPAVVSKVKKLFDACDTARFAFTKADGRKMRDDKKELEDIVKYFERRKI